MDEITKKRLLRTLQTQSTPIVHRLPSISEARKKQESMINCYECRFFGITWERNMPYSCAAYGFKGPQIPSATVKSSSGEVCRFFQPKQN